MIFSSLLSCQCVTQEPDEKKIVKHKSDNFVMSNMLSGGDVKECQLDTTKRWLISVNLPESSYSLKIFVAF